MTSQEAFDQLLQAAQRCLDEGRVAEGIAAHQHLLELHPHLSDSWYNLGYLQQRNRQYEAALHSYQLALDNGVASPEEVHLNRAVLLAEALAQPEQAQWELERALALNPRYCPAQINLGNLHEQCGHRAAAMESYERALEIDPNNALALSRLPNVATLQGANDPLISRLKHALSTMPGRPLAERADLGFGLGKALDMVGAYDEAFAAFSAANQASQQLMRPAQCYDRTAHERLVNKLIELFPGPAALPQKQHDLCSRVFVCGLFRSGSSLAEQILASHPRVTAGGEIDLLPALFRPSLLQAMENKASLTTQVLQGIRDTYASGVTALAPHADVVTDKRMDNFLYIGLIKTIFPEATIVHTRRHPLDTGLAIFFQHIGPSMPWSASLSDIGHWTVQYQKLMEHWHRAYPGAIHELDYDALVQRPEVAMRELLAACHLEWDERCLRFHETSSQVRTPSAWQVRQPMYTKASGRWQHYAKHLQPLRDALGYDSLT